MNVLCCLPKISWHILSGLQEGHLPKSTVEVESAEIHLACPIACDQMFSLSAQQNFFRNSLDEERDAHYGNSFLKYAWILDGKICQFSKCSTSLFITRLKSESVFMTAFSAQCLFCMCAHFWSSTFQGTNISRGLRQMNNESGDTILSPAHWRKILSAQMKKGGKRRAWSSISS